MEMIVVAFAYVVRRFGFGSRVGRVSRSANGAVGAQEKMSAECDAGLNGLTNEIIVQIIIIT